MEDHPLEARPNIIRLPIHESITVDQISRLVDLFYSRVQKHTRLGPVFDEKLQGRWDEHLVKMKSFWRSVLLKTGEYKGQPMPAHVRLKTAVSEDFQIWLGLFRDTAFECFDAEAAPLVIEVAERIAQSFWLGMFGTPFSSPPQWMSSQSLNQVTEC